MSSLNFDIHRILNKTFKKKGYFKLFNINYLFNTPTLKTELPNHLPLFKITLQRDLMLLIIC